MYYPCPVTAQIEEVTHGFSFRQGDQNVANAKTKNTLVIIKPGHGLRWY
jgi:hypothetical protein